MFAILISNENLPQIRESELFSEEDETYHIDPYLRHQANWYLIKGYVPYLGALQDYGIVPQYILDDNFEHDPEKIQTNWDQIVRK